MTFFEEGKMYQWILNGGWTGEFLGMHNPMTAIFMGKKNDGMYEMKCLVPIHLTQFNELEDDYSKYRKTQTSLHGRVLAHSIPVRKSDGVL